MMFGYYLVWDLPEDPPPEEEVFENEVQIE
jgi:hypothetical protein